MTVIRLAVCDRKITKCCLPDLASLILVKTAQVCKSLVLERGSPQSPLESAVRAPQEALCSDFKISGESMQCRHSSGMASSSNVHEDLSSGAAMRDATTLGKEV